MRVVDAFDRVPLLRALPSAHREALIAGADLRWLNRGEPVEIREIPASSYHFVVLGFVKLTQVRLRPDQRPVVISLVGPGRLVCPSVAFRCAPLCCRPVAGQDGTVLLTLPPRALYPGPHAGGASTSSITGDPALTSAMLDEALIHSDMLCRRVHELASSTVRRKIVSLFEHLAVEMGIDDGPDGRRIPISLRRQDVADLCGTTVETTVRIMRELHRSGLVRTAVGGFLIPSMKALQTLADGGPSPAQPNQELSLPGGPPVGAR